MRSLGRFLLTLAVVVVAVFAGARVWAYYMNEPWTRDGRVRADVVGLAPDVSGLVADVLVRDNQPVKQGDVLFRLDLSRFQFAVLQADAEVKSRLAALQEAQLETQRYHALSNVEVSQEKQQQTQSAAEQAAAAYQQALADRGIAQLNLDRATVRAPVNGIVSNFELRPGDYVTAGHAVIALVDTDSLHVDGYFEETKLPRIRIGDPAQVQLMGEDRWLAGRVDSIAGGIADRDRSSDTSLLADVNPTFNWVRLAQRVPVRIVLDKTPDDIRLIPGRTATVRIEGPDGARPGLLSSLRWP
jgi:RND family efflux transporter MFP subunit